jgi:DnaJ-class molecular chaperone
MNNEIVELTVKCPKCEGNGHYFDNPADTSLIDLCMICLGHGKIKVQSNQKICGKCNGKGKIILQRNTPFGIQKVLSICDRCLGNCIVTSVAA